MKNRDFFCCDQCGECCRHIDRVPQLQMYDNGKGICIHLKENLCDIYETRPDICRVDVMYEKDFYKIYSKDEYYYLNKKACRELKNVYKKRKGNLMNDKICHFKHVE